MVASLIHPSKTMLKWELRFKLGKKGDKLDNSIAHQLGRGFNE